MQRERQVPDWIFGLPNWNLRGARSGGSHLWTAGVVAIPHADLVEAASIRLGCLCSFAVHMCARCHPLTSVEAYSRTLRGIFILSSSSLSLPLGCPNFSLQARVARHKSSLALWHYLHNDARCKIPTRCTALNTRAARGVKYLWDAARRKRHLRRAAAQNECAQANARRHCAPSETPAHCKVHALCTPSNT